MTLRLVRPAYFSGAGLAFLLSVVVFAALVTLLAWSPAWLRGPEPTAAPLIVHCAAAMRAPMDAAAREYTQRYSVPIELNYGGSQTLLAGIELSKRGDLYLAADDSYLQLAQVKDLLDERLDLARMKAVLAVAQGNPHGIHSLADILRGGIKVSQANPDAAAIGKVARDALVRSGKWDAFRARITNLTLTVTEVANDVALEGVDAGIVWDATVRQVPGLEAVELSELAGATGRVAIGVLRTSTQPTAALRFARFLASRDVGLPLFRANGFEVVEGDRWSEEPELLLFAGAMLKPAIEETVNDFERREGVRVSRVYNGCGILVGQMRASHSAPDAYFACDQSFMDMVHDLFAGPAAVSNNRLAILVPRGNPHGIRGLDDLAKPGLRVGVGHEKQCALGALTQKTLEQSGRRAAVMKNIKVQTPTGDMLVNQLLTGSLDAVIAYVSNARASESELGAIPVDVPCALAVQPLAVSKNSDYRHLASRLADALRSPLSRQRFEAAGFHWQEVAPPK